MVPRYRELAPAAEVAGLVVCTWERTLDEPSPAPVVPDGCIDLVVLPDGALLVAGPDTRPAPVAPGAGAVAGLRFHPGRAPAVLGVPARALRDQRVPLEDVWDREGRRLAELVRETPDASARRLLLEDAVARRRAEAVRDPLVEAAVARLREPRAPQVSELARELAIGERQLLRRFGDAVGYGPRTLRRVLRLRRLLDALQRGGDEDLAWLARDLGYADQAHMTRECASLAGRTPAVIRGGG